MAIDVTCVGILVADILAKPVESLPEKGKNALAANGQTLALPENTRSVALLLTSADGDKKVTFRSGDRQTTVFVPDCMEAIGAWDLYGMKEKGYVKPCTLAYEITHTHTQEGNAVAKQCWLFRVDVPAEGELTLPHDPDVLIFAAAAFPNEVPAGALQPLYDQLEKEEFDFVLPDEK